MMSLTFGLFTQVSGSGPLGPLVLINQSFLFIIFQFKPNSHKINTTERTKSHSDVCLPPLLIRNSSSEKPKQQQEQATDKLVSPKKKDPQIRQKDQDQQPSTSSSETERCSKKSMVFVEFFYLATAKVPEYHCHIDISLGVLDFLL